MRCVERKSIHSCGITIAFQTFSIPHIQTACTHSPIHRDRHTQSDTHTHTHTHRLTHSHTNSDSDSHTHSETYDLLRHVNHACDVPPENYVTLHNYNNYGYPNGGSLDKWLHISNSLHFQNIEVNHMAFPHLRDMAKGERGERVCNTHQSLFSLENGITLGLIRPDFTHRKKRNGRENVLKRFYPFLDQKDLAATFLVKIRNFGLK